MLESGFIVPMNPKYTIYKKVVHENIKKLKSAENFLSYKDKFLYVKKLHSVIGKNKENGKDVINYIFLCKNVPIPPLITQEEIAH